MTTNEIYFNMVEKQLEQFVPVTKKDSMRQLQDDIKFLAHYMDKLTWHEFGICYDIIKENLSYTRAIFKFDSHVKYYFKHQLWAIKNNYKYNNSWGNEYRIHKYFF